MNYLTTLIIIITVNLTLVYATFSLSPKSSIVFATLGRLRYDFDIYTSSIYNSQSPPFITNGHDELKLTDGVSVNYNGFFAVNSEHNDSLPATIQLVYVSERNGTSNIYLDSVPGDSVSQLGQSVVVTGDSTSRLGDSVGDSVSRLGVRTVLELPSRVQVPLLGTREVSMKDRPSLIGENLIYVATREDTGVARTSWTAVYSTHLPTGSTRRLTPTGVADFSPAVSPSRIWTAVASYGLEGWGGEIEELKTDIYIFLTRDGSSRVKIVEHGGWPSWVDENTIYFHMRNSDDGWWSVYKASFKRVGRARFESVVVERVTPPGLHAFTPATSPGNYKFIALATRRPGFDYRHIELFDLVEKKFKVVTRPITPEAHHYNPFISPDSTRVGYHKCSGGSNGRQVLLENLKNPENGLSLFRVDGSFPSFSPTGDRIAYADLDNGYVYVVDNDGSNRRVVLKGHAFATAWNPVRKGVVYSSLGPTFASERTKVDIVSINVDDGEISYKRLTQGGQNNAFPSPSPDGKWVVFRSGRSGHKNLYIMDAEEGEARSIQRLTDGPWDDTMCNWSPTGEWIAFASDRENPGSGSFEIFMIHPNGTELHKVIQSGSGGRANHPWFSPDGKSFVFTSDYAGVSAEPVSNPHHYQPYGDIFIANIDGSHIRRLTHNSYEDGTPTWGPMYMSPVNVVKSTDGPNCGFQDCHWLDTEPGLAGLSLSIIHKNMSLGVVGKC